MLVLCNDRDSCFAHRCKNHTGEKPHKCQDFDRFFPIEEGEGMSKGGRSQKVGALQ